MHVAYETPSSAPCLTAQPKDPSSCTLSQPSKTLDERSIVLSIFGVDR